MFFGTYTHRLNTKNQVTVPSRLRAQAEREGDEIVFYIIPKGDRCLYLYTRSELERVFGALRKKATGPVEDIRRLLSSEIRSVECDRQGRVLIPEDLKDAVGMGREVVFVGNAERVELWPAQRWSEYQAQTAGEYSARMDEIVEEFFEW